MQAQQKLGQKKLCLKNFWSKKNVGPIELSVSQNFGSNKILGPEHPLVMVLLARWNKMIITDFWSMFKFLIYFFHQIHQINRKFDLTPPIIKNLSLQFSGWITPFWSSLHFFIGQP